MCGGAGYLQEVEFEDALLIADAAAHKAAHVVAVRGDDVLVEEVARDCGLADDERRLRLVLAALEDDRLDRDRDALPLPCTTAVPSVGDGAGRMHVGQKCARSACMSGRSAPGAHAALWCGGGRALFGSQSLPPITSGTPA